MGDHYIPKYYLQGFTSPKDGMIWVYEKNGDLKFQSQVVNVANENNYYEPEVEKYLANQIEGPANAVIKKIRERKSINKSDKEKLAIYMIVMYKRVPQSIIRMNEMAPGIAEKMKNQWDQDIDELIKEEPEKAEFYNSRREELHANLDKYSKNPPKDFWLSLIPPDRTPNIVMALKQMNWCFLTWDEYPTFLTCDNPVFHFPWMGIGKSESEVTFPISSNIVLLANWRTNIKETYYETNEKAIREINQRTAFNTTRFAYHARDEYWIPKFICKKKTNFNLLVI